MPNHCENDLKINGSKEDILKFFDAVRGPEHLIDANKIIPYPKRFADADKAAQDYQDKGGDWATRPKDGYNSGGYEWCISNWGTKWGMYEFSEIKFGKTYAAVSFQSAWAPPLPLILKASEMFPNLTFTLKYYEQGVGFKGTYKTQAGQVLQENESTYRGTRGG